MGSVLKSVTDCIRLWSALFWHVRRESATSSLKMATLTRRGTTPNHKLGTKMVPPKMPWRVWLVARLLARARGQRRNARGQSLTPRRAPRRALMIFRSEFIYGCGIVRWRRHVQEFWLYPARNHTLMNVQRLSSVQVSIVCDSEVSYGCEIVRWSRHVQ